MKKFFKNVALSFSGILALGLASCSNDGGPKGPDEDQFETVTIGFQKVSADLIAGPTSYGANLYSEPGQITKGYIVQIYGETYAQFSINYAEQSYLPGQPWEYSFYNGGLAVSNWHDMQTTTYENQLSVYSSTSPSGGNFVVANGYASVDNPNNATLADYDGCGKVYLTDSQGYGLTTEGQKSPVTGEAKDGYFQSVMLNNTTYCFKTMENGDAFASALNSENKGWFKVQFIAFDSNDATAKPAGYTEAYLANFDPSQADGYLGIIDEWIQVDLSMLPKAEILVINFVGSDSGEWGLNTPAYCALDNFEISIEK